MYREYKFSRELKMSSGFKVVLFLGSTRDGRLGVRVAKFMKKEMEKRGHSVDMWDPIEMKFPMVEKPIHFYGPSREGAPEWLKDAETRIREADAYLLVTCEYNHCLPPALTNMIDHFPGSAFSYKPSGIVCYSPGIYGGMRAAMQARALTGELGCISVSNIFGIPQVQNALDPEGVPQNDHMEKGAGKLLDQLDWMTGAMKNHRNAVGIPS